MIIVYTGDGKGKSSAAIGAIIRALGWEKRVEAYFLLKGWWKSGERKLLEDISKKNQNLSLNYYPYKNWVKSPDDKAKKVVKNGIDDLLLAISRKPFMVIADELITAYALKLVTIDELISIIELSKRKRVNLVLTGRGWPKKLNRSADIVTDMKKVVHCYDKGQKAKKCIDW